LLNKDWYPLETKPEHPLYVSDNPVVPENRTEFGPYGNIGLTVFGIQMYLPLSSTLMLAMYCPSIREQKIRDKQDVHDLLARAPHLIPRHTRPCEKLRASQQVYGLSSHPAYCGSCDAV
jgi:Short chain fatty acids transporter